MRSRGEVGPGDRPGFGRSVEPRTFERPPEPLGGRARPLGTPVLAPRRGGVPPRPAVGWKRTRPTFRPRSDGRDRGPGGAPERREASRRIRREFGGRATEARPGEKSLPSSSSLLRKISFRGGIGTIVPGGIDGLAGSTVR